MTIETFERKRRKLETRTFAGHGRSLREFEIVCLFSALGLLLTSVAMMLGWFADMASAFAPLAY